LKSTETHAADAYVAASTDFSNFGSLKSTETCTPDALDRQPLRFQQFRLVEEH